MKRSNVRPGVKPPGARGKAVATSSKKLPDPRQDVTKKKGKYCPKNKIEVHIKSKLLPFPLLFVFTKNKSSPPPSSYGLILTFFFLILFFLYKLLEIKL